MLKRMKQTVLAASVGLALAAPAGAFAATGVNFDLNGAAGGSAFTLIGQMDWGADNLLAKGCFPVALVGAGGCTLYLQAKLSSFKNVDLTTNTPGYSEAVDGEYTMQLVIQVTPVLNLAGGSAAAPAIGSSIQFNAIAGQPGTLTIYHDTTPDASAVAGTGYSDGNVVLVGDTTIDAAIVSVITNSALAPINGSPAATNPAYANVDTFGNASGGGTMSVGVTVANGAYIQGGLTGFMLQLKDASEDNSANLPFTTVPPANSVVGQTPDFGGLVAGRQRNNFVCDGNPGTCDMLFQNDASTTFESTPVAEPGSLALLGLGLSAFGLRLRRKSKAV